MPVIRPAVVAACSHVAEITMSHKAEPVCAQRQGDEKDRDSESKRETLTDCHGLRQARCLQDAGDGGGLCRWAGLHTETHAETGMWTCRTSHMIW